MVQFKRVFSPILRLHPKFRESIQQRTVAPTAFSVNRFIQPRCLRNRGHLKFKSTSQDSHPSTDTILGSVDEVDEFDFDFEDDDTSSKNYFDVDVESTDMILAEPESVDKHALTDAASDEHDDEDADSAADVPSPAPARERTVKRIYTGVAETDQELAALHADHGDEISHVVRVVFESPSSRGGDTIAPSHWKIEEVTPSGGGPAELRLTCPAMIPHFDYAMSLLTEKQVQAARKYIARVLPSPEDVPAGQGFALTLSPEEREHARVLVVGPRGRRVDTLAILFDGDSNSVFGDTWLRPVSFHLSF